MPSDLGILLVQWRSCALHQANDIRAAVTHVREMTGSGPVSLICASFGGGISAFFAVGA
jgi:hypothetical protein